MPVKTCVICGKEFFTSSSRRSYCYDPHYHPCPICGEPVLTKDLYHLNECCCSEHSRKLAIQTTHDRFENWPANSDEAKVKRKQTCLERYGVENVSLDPSFKKKISKALIKANKEHPEYRQRGMQTYFERTGYLTPMQNPEIQAAIKQRFKDKYGTENPFEPFKDRANATNIERYGTAIPMQNSQVWAKQRSHKSSYTACDGTPLDSSYEVDVYNYCIRNSIPIKRTVPLPFEYEGNQHKTFIDFEIDGLLVEVKGEHIMECYFDDQPNAVPMWKKIEVYKENNVILVTGSSVAYFFNDSFGIKYASDLDKPLIGVDIQLFRDPQFPYSPKRPKCFYDVRVSGQRSSYEAFHDERLRWSMIKNRIQYVGGFISSKQVLTAMNVTRTCKQPSWFSMSYAEKLLRKYSVSDVIVDPFAGWGTRHDASVKLGKAYLGCDTNSELVRWHKEQGRSIELMDAKDFKYSDKCDVFICPPYKDIEVYTDSQDCKMDQCDWLDLIRRNVPNANRYIMVCKEVDDRYSSSIVEIKENKSHFGRNQEYVIVVENSNLD